MPSKLIKRTAVVAALGATLMAPAAADAHTGWHACAGGGGSVQWTGYGMYMHTSYLQVRSPMNCASGRYALQVARQKFRRTASLPMRYWDGYVTWYGHVVRGPLWAGGIVQWREYATGTTFRAHVSVFSD